MKEKFYLFISIIIFSSSLYFYVYTENNLSPYSVNVRGYYRSDGTYVSPHSRRPPGSVKKDQPYELIRGFLIILLISSGGAIIGYLYVEIDTLLEKRRKKIANIKLQKNNFADDDIEGKIRFAIANGLEIYFSYVNNKGEKSQRTIKPFYLVVYKGTYCVRGYCFTRNTDRSFALGRIKNLSVKST